MYIVIVGCGGLGSALATKLADEGHNVAIVDRDKNAFKKLGTGFNGLEITGVGIDEDVLRNAGIERADALAAVTRDDNINIMVAQIASKIYNIKRVIARIYDPERKSAYRDFEIETVCPTTMGVNEIRNILIANGVKKRFELDNGISILEIKVKKNVNMTVYDIEDKFDLRVSGIKRESTIIAHDSTIVKKDDILIVTMKEAKAEALARYLGNEG
ncbi:TrkA family potassium uptake protein [Thermoanaerobacterium sp. RBIITD]|uniref:potassium channel family protein n=1 Tax=Thermoanaerobacterium sp. RBIITD TaxID=1550240 RepID=UPI000BBFF2FB|nr:TrkA family potassium uptake protein [Thermoanaerobacterium sp. RBIITD]SNX52954.1 TrkA-C domain-containing protein [Thermoanaerobacterium sp. RBIITD]